MRRLTILVAAGFLGGCAGLPASVDQVVERAGEVADTALGETESALCSQRWSLRAYYSRYGARWPELVAFCQWDQAPPGPEQ